MKRLLAAVLAAATALAPLTLAVPSVAVAQDQVLNVQNADIRAFIQDVARATGRTFVIDPRVQGTVSVASDRPLSRAELLEVLFSTLRANGLVAVQTGPGAYRVTPEQGAAGRPATVGGQGAAGFATQVFQIRNVDARQLAESIKPLVGASGVVVASPQGDALIVADYADNLRRIRGLIAEVDQDRFAVETLTLVNSSATELAQVLDRLNGVGGTPGSGGGTLSVVPVISSNSLILRGDRAAVDRAAALVRDLDARAQSSADVRVIRLQHANAEQLAPVLQQLIGQTPDPVPVRSSASDGAPAQAAAAPAAAGQAAPLAPVAGRRASVTRYPGANALIVSADPETQRVLADVVRQLDTRREQVLVEAIVVEVSDQAARQLGVQFLLAGANRTDVPFLASNYSNARPSILGLGTALVGERNLDEDDPALDDLREAAVSSLSAVTGGIAGFGGEIADDVLFGMIINAVRSDSQSNLLSTPSVLTLDNEEATILVGQEVPITTGEALGSNNANPFRTFERRNVGIQLEVKPQINAGGGITLFLRQEVSSVAGPVAAGSTELVFNKREVETTVLADDGDIVVLGGLLEESERASVQRVPGLGDVPGLGALFRSKGREGGKTNLMVFIRPTILRTTEQTRAATAARYGQVRDAQAEATGRDSLDRLVRERLQALPPSERPGPRPEPAAGAPVGTP